MAICTEKIKDKATGKMVDKKVDGKIQYYIRTYVNDEFGKKKQITRHNKEWLGREGYWKAQQEENRLRNGYMISIQPEVKKITLKEGMELYLKFIEPRVDEDTYRAKKIMLQHFCEIDKTGQVTTYPNKYINLFNKNIYTDWQIQMRKKTYTKKNANQKNNISIEHLNRIHNNIVKMLDYLIDEELCKVNFAKQCGKFGTPKEIKMSKLNKIYETIDFDEYTRLLQASSDNLKYNTYFHLEFTRGPRTGEIRAFRICDYNPQKKQLMVNHTMSKYNKLKEPKTASSKAPIDLDNDLNKKIKLIIDNLKQCDGFNEEWYIFGNENPISSNALQYARDKYFKLAKIDRHLRLHDFRHSCATWLFSIGIPITVVSKILRHADIKETMKTYTHLLNDDYKKSLDIIDKYSKQDQKQDQSL